MKIQSIGKVKTIAGPAPAALKPSLLENTSFLFWLNRAIISTDKLWCRVAAIKNKIETGVLLLRRFLIWRVMKKQIYLYFCIVIWQLSQQCAGFCTMVLGGELCCFRVAAFWGE